MQLKNRTWASSIGIPVPVDWVIRKPISLPSPLAKNVFAGGGGNGVPGVWGCGLGRHHLDFRVIHTHGLPFRDSLHPDLTSDQCLITQIGG